MKPSLKYGLPYGWWRTDGFKNFVGGTVFSIVGGTYVAALLLAWFLDLKPWW